METASTSQLPQAAAVAAERAVVPAAAAVEAEEQVLLQEELSWAR